jgi:hypothetical protein
VPYSIAIDESMDVKGFVFIQGVNEDFELV